MSGLREAWDNNPPAILYLAMPFPNALDLPLSGSGTARMSIESFLQDLQLDCNHQEGHYFAYVFNSNREEADIYRLIEWEVVGGTKCHEAVVFLYYSPVSPYRTVLKYMPDLAEQYKQQNPIEFVDLDSLERRLAEIEPG